MTLGSNQTLRPIPSAHEHLTPAVSRTIVMTTVRLEYYNTTPTRSQYPAGGILARTVTRTSLQRETT